MAMLKHYHACEWCHATYEIVEAGSECDDLHADPTEHGKISEPLICAHGYCDTKCFAGEREVGSRAGLDVIDYRGVA